MKTLKNVLREEGFAQFIAIILVALLIFTGLAYMKWGAEESWEAMFEKHKLQAYYAAHAGVMDLGFKELRALKIDNVPEEEVELGISVLKDASGNIVASAKVYRDPDINKAATVFGDYNYIDYKGVGKVVFKDYEGNDASITDSMTLKIKLVGLAEYFYLTDNETTPFGEVIKFWHEDTLEGWVHSNDTIAIMENPVFYDKVTTVAPVFWQGIGYNPQFLGPLPIFEYGEVFLPTEATELRAAAAAQGNFFDSDDGYWAHRLVFMNYQGWRMYRWEMGTPFEPATAIIIGSGGIETWGAIFVEGYLEMKGVVRGKVTVGASGHPFNPQNPDGHLGKHCIRLLDDVRYHFANVYNGSFDDTSGINEDILGIISESNITIANTWENGRENQGGPAPDNKDIIITAAMIALGNETINNYWGSFSFEEQNEADGGTTPDPTIWEWYNGSYECPVPPNSDERGDIHLWGAVSQRRRGYVHRSNHGGTGYGKDYHFDDRFRFIQPPYFIKATDSEGSAHWQVVSWGDKRKGKGL